MKKSKVTPKQNRFLHARNQNNAVSIKDIYPEPVTKETRYVEGGFNPFPFVKTGIRQEKTIKPKTRIVKINGKLYCV